MASAGGPILKFNLFLLILLVMSCSSSLPKKRTDKLSIVQGITNSKEIEFSVVALKNRSLRFEIRSAEGDIIAPDEVKVVTRDFSDYGIHKMVFVRDPKKIYNLYAYEAEKIIDQRLVGRGQLQSTKLRLAIVSCMDDTLQDKFVIWDEIAKRNPEYLLMIGDNVYVQRGTKTLVASPEIIWKRYIDVRLSLPVFFQEKLIPVHALWDDNDFGQSNGGEKYEFKKDSKEIFESFFAQELSNDDYLKGFGVGGLLSLGDFNLYFLDARSFRAEHQDGRHLGMDQENWLLTRLNEEATPSLLIKGDQFFGAYHHFESFQGKHPEDFEKFTGQLKKSDTPFVFVSGDRHMSEIMQFPRGLFGKPSFEITSSPVHGKTYPASVEVNPWRVVAQKANVNFTIMDNLARDDHWFMEVENIGALGETYYRRELAVFIKDLQNNLNEVRKRRSGKRRYRPRRSKRK